MASDHSTKLLINSVTRCIIWILTYFPLYSNCSPAMVHPPRLVFFDYTDDVLNHCDSSLHEFARVG